NPLNLIAMNGILYFTADDGVHGRELWQSAGTPAGTFLVRDINPGRGSAFHSFYNPWFTVANGKLFFVADDRVHGRELWVYTWDGAAAREGRPRGAVHGHGRAGGYRVPGGGGGLRSGGGDRDGIRRGPLGGESRAGPASVPAAGADLAGERVGGTIVGGRRMAFG